MLTYTLETNDKDFYIISSNNKEFIKFSKKSNCLEDVINYCNSTFSIVIDVKNQIENNNEVKTPVFVSSLNTFYTLSGKKTDTNLLYKFIDLLFPGYESVIVIN